MQQQKPKSLLAEYCQRRRLDVPTYTSENVGPTNEPSWTVTVGWGDQEYITPEPIDGTKKAAEQEAARQVLEMIEEKQQAHTQTTEDHSEAFLSGGFAQALGQSEQGSQPTPMHGTDPITVPIEMLTAALGIANHRWGERKRAWERNRQRQPYTGSVETAAQYAKEVAQLAVEIVRELDAAAKRELVVWHGTRQPVS